MLSTQLTIPSPSTWKSTTQAGSHAYNEMGCRENRVRSRSLFMKWIAISDAIGGRRLQMHWRIG